MLHEFDPVTIALIALIYVWTGFVRSGLGFGGSALGLPLMLFVVDQPLFWLPVIGWHLLFFSILTLRTRLDNVDWGYLRRSALFIVPAALAGVFGLLNLPTHWLVVFIYTVTLFYAFTWVANLDIRSTNHWLDKGLLLAGGYIAGTSLTGAPLMVAVYARNVAAAQLRDTLFVLWFILVTIKMSTFAALGVNLQWQNALLLLPVAAIGHVVGLKTHEHILQNDQRFKRVLGGMLMLVSLLGLWQLR
jgi:uncharacterized membrane protein YfcA